MGLHAPEGSQPNVLFNQWASGYVVWGVDSNFNTIEDFDASDGSEIRVEVGDDYIAIKTKADYDEAVSLLKGIGWTDDQITKVFEQLGLERDGCDDEDNGEDDDYLSEDDS